MEAKSPEALQESGGAILTAATPLDTDRKRGPVAKRRFQKGSFVIKNGMAYSFYYEDVQQPDGLLASRRVRHPIGRISEDGLSERAARREHDRMMQAVNAKRGSMAPAIKGRTFQNAVDAWRKAIAPNLSPATVRQHESYLRKHILPKFKNEAPHTLTVALLQQFATDLRATLSRKTVLNILSAIFAILKFAERCNIPVAKVSFADLQLGVATSDAERPFFTKEQAGQIISAAKEPYKTLFTVAWLTGMRAGEILALKTSDLDFKNRTIRVDESSDDNTRKLRQPKTKKSVALLPMPKALEAALQSYLENVWQSNTVGLLFPNRKGTHPLWRDNVVKYGLKPILKALKIPAHNAGLHAFRHGLATELAQRAIPLPDLQKQMRHADVRTTLRIYSHSIPGTQRAAMESVADSLLERPIGTNVPIGTQQKAQRYLN
jgi:integrase